MNENDSRQLPTPPHPELPARWNRILLALVACGAATVAAGAILAPARSGASFMLAVYFATGLGLAGLLFVAFQHVTQASWSVVLRRVPEAMAATLPVVLILAGVVLAMVPVLYEWTDVDKVAADPLLQQKSSWLDQTWFTIRTVICGGAWLLFAWLIVGGSRRQDRSGTPSRKRRLAGFSGVFLAVFAITFSVVSIDWVMSLEPHWFSTVFALYNFSGMFLGGLAAIGILVILLRRLGPLDGIVTADHLHDLAKLTFSFSVFWAYIWFCQYMLIWYGNIPEETSYFIHRQEGAWGVLFVVNLFVNWIVPFLILLPRPAKRSESTLLWVSILLILGRWLDLYLLILPSFFHGDDPGFGLWEILPVLGVLSLFVLAFFRSMRRAAVVPLGDPLLEESLHHHQ